MEVSGWSHSCGQNISIRFPFQGNTQAYSKSGYRMATFQSVLPGGNHNDCKGCTILDCIWSAGNYSYYVLDVLAWCNQPVIDCEV